MIFHAARLATEKAVFRPALPLCSLPGMTEMQMGREYIERLKDPRWQKLRLLALQAGGWKCAECENSEETLHVHHRQYFKGRNPWEYEVGQLEVLCASCHAMRHEDVSDDPLLIAASYVPSVGFDNREAVASLIAGFCGHPMGSSHVDDPLTWLAGVVARSLDAKSTAIALDQLGEALQRRNAPTVRAALSAFIEDLNSRPDEPEDPRSMEL